VLPLAAFPVLGGGLVQRDLMERGRKRRRGEEGKESGRGGRGWVSSVLAVCYLSISFLMPLLFALAFALAFAVAIFISRFAQGYLGAEGVLLCCSCSCSAPFNPVLCFHVAAVLCSCFSPGSEPASTLDILILNSIILTHAT
jgi:hypothetical protein